MRHCIPMNVAAIFLLDEQIALSILIFVGTIIAGLALRRIGYGVLRRAAHRSKNESLGHFDDVLEHALRIPFLLWTVIVAVFASVGYLAVFAAGKAGHRKDCHGVAARVVYDCRGGCAREICPAVQQRQGRNRGND